MVNRLFNLASLLSAIAFCVVVVAWVAAAGIDPGIDPRKQFLSVSPDFHVSLGARGADARVKVFNDSTYGPYAGSIVGFAGDPNGPTTSGFGDFAGVYYRMIRWPNGSSLWTLSLSLFYPLLAASALPIAWRVRRWRRSRKGFALDR
ncbi:hypothetical protein [Humisphaera borealis]|uniref:Uncharacterized protein n=1 Tax=Humisphaera borealis TaxID=2807512 RepID=A0A7M2WPP6_9BACT|nr:hypothetical protein [Humisphaera borealis]QOV87379.1 hypothetical protein IPV69_13875 [Humisphaera borealis]